MFRGKGKTYIMQDSLSQLPLVFLVFFSREVVSFYRIHAERERFMHIKYLHVVMSDMRFHHAFVCARVSDTCVRACMSANMRF